MQRWILALAFLLAGCVRDNPAFTDAVPAAPGTLGGPPASHDAGPSLADLASTAVVDMAQPHDPAHPPDLSMNGGGPVGDGVACGTQTCASPAFCCVGLGAPACVDPGPGACPGGKHVSCDGPEDCSDGAACCGSPFGSSCSKSCPDVAALCHDASDCHDADHCCPTQLGYSICSKQSC